ncbi:MAG: HAD family hydrolase [Candidatus Aenigmarchaeota archaeon]|nr:HAD family hydrolase [Candidatus Aenigmarchaeota archaeon]
MKDFYLFDLDGTLIDSMKLHIESFRRAYKHVFNAIVDDEVFNRNAGKTASTFHMGVCSELGINPTESDIRKIGESWKEYMEGAVKNEGIRVLPGVIEFLNEIKSRNQTCGLITGNSQNVGKYLLESAGLSEFFKIQSYSDGLYERSDLIKKSLSNANEMGLEIERLIVIGDTPSDIKAGKIMKGFAVGVETGPYRKDKLEEAGADLVLKNLKEYELIFEKIE